MAEREITIRISAQNMSAAGFAAARQELLGLKDATASTTAKGFELKSTFSNAFSVIGMAAAAAGGALVALGAGVVALGDRGSQVGDLKNAFETLNQAIGNNADTLTGTLKQAFRGTLSEAQIFEATNTALSQGLKLNEEQFKTTALGARVLADRLGVDTVEAYDKLLQAMATGKDRQIEQIGLNIDGKAVLEEYAAALGVSTSELSESEQAAAKKAAILRELEQALIVSGEAETDFSDRIAQAKAFATDLIDKVAIMIADSPVLAAGFDGVATALGAAFGGDTQSLAETVVGLIEEGAIVVMDFAQAGLAGADIVVQSFYAVRAVLFDALSSIMSVETGMRELAAGALESAAAIPGVGRAFADSAREAREAAIVHAGMRDGLRDTAAEAHRAADGQNTLSRGIQTLRGGLADARDAMVRAQQATADQRQATGDATEAVRSHTAARRVDGAALDEHTARLRRSTDAAEDAGVVWGNLASTAPIVAMQIKGVLNESLIDLETLTDNASEAMAELREAMFRVQGQAITLGPVLQNSMQLPFAQFAPTVRQATTEGEGFFSRLLGGAEGVGSSVSSIFQAAFTGGGGALGAVKAFATQTLSTLINMIPGIPPWVAAFAGPIVEMFSRLIAKSKDFFRALFGGPSRAELNDRSLVQDFEDEVIAALSAQQQAESGGERWRQVVIGIRDAYIAAGRTAEEAERDVARLWESSREGGEETWRVIDEIRRKTQEQGQAASDAIDRVGDALANLPDVVDIQIRGHYQAPDPVDGGRYGVGTKGVHGTWFHDFRPGQLVSVDPDEAIVPRARLHEFIQDVAGSRGGGSPSVHVAPMFYVLTSDPGTRIVTQDQLPAAMQQLLASGQVRVPARVVSARL